MVETTGNAAELKTSVQLGNSIELRNCGNEEQGKIRSGLSGGEVNSSIFQKTV